MAKQKTIDEILELAKKLKGLEFGQLREAELKYLDKKEKYLVQIKSRLQEEADAMHEAYINLLNCSQTYEKKDLEFYRDELFKADETIVDLCIKFRKATGYDSPYYFKYCNFADKTYKRIIEIERNRNRKIDGEFE